MRKRNRIIIRLYVTSHYEINNGKVLPVEQEALLPLPPLLQTKLTEDSLW